MSTLTLCFQLESALDFHRWEALTACMEIFFLQKTNLNDLEIMYKEESLLLMTGYKKSN